LKLERVESGNDQAWYCLGDNSVNVLEDIIPFNFRETALSIPYAYILYNGESTVMPYGEAGGNWMIDHRTGVVYIPDVENVTTLDPSGLYLTFYKYVGGKGVGIEYDRNNNLTVQPSGGFISFGNGNITTNTGYPNYQTLGTEYIVNPPSVSNTVYGVNITAMNKRTRASYASAEACVNTWTSRTPAADNSWQSVCWSPELSLFVAVAKTGTDRVMTSSDGITWTSRSVPDGEWYSVCWSPELSLFVAVSMYGTYWVMTSPDGINWTSRTAAANNIWQSVCWSPELSLFVAVGQSGTHRVMTSSDGINWVSKTAAANNSWFSVCWSPDLALFVAVAISGTYRVMTSPDGNTWTSILVPDGEWYSVCWSPELLLFVAVGYNSNSNVSQRVITSSDGINWTSRTAASNDNWQSVCWSPELSLFVAVGQTGTNNRVMTSPDGINWTSRTPAADNGWISICWSPELSIFVAISFTGTNNRVMTSSIGMPNSKSVVKALPSQMMVDVNGNVGIGTTSPVGKLQINNESISVNTEELLTLKNTYGTSSASNIVFRDYSNIVGKIGSIFDGTKISFTFSHLYNNGYQTGELMRISGDGNVGIGITPVQKLHVNGHITVGAHDSQPTSTTVLVSPDGQQNALMFYNRYYTWGGGSTIHGSPGYRIWNNFISSKFHSNDPYSGSASYHAFLLWTYNPPGGTSDVAMRMGSGNGNSKIWVNGSTSVSSDRRIKTNIIDVPDDLALEMVRKIPCRYYEYKRDIYNEYEYGREKPNRTIGFIAQEVKDICPEAVSLTDYKIPFDNRIYRDLDIQIDNSNNFIIIKDFTNNDLSGNDELECIINPINNNNITEDNVEQYMDSNDSKVINIKYISDCKFEILDDISNVEIQEIILKNKKIDDFHTLDKNKLFALNFSATQEIDRQQQADKVKIATLQARNEELEAKVTTLESELSAIKAHLGL